MDLPLDIVRTRGRAIKRLTAVVVRPLMAEDMQRLGEEERSTQPPLLKRLRERHHALARMLAAGHPDGVAAAICGYDVSRVSILKADPTFRNLMEFYREDVNRQYADVHSQLAGMSLDALIMLRERMEEREGEEELSTNQLLEIARMGADRTGFGPATKAEVNVNVNLADRLQEARKRLAERTIELKRND